MNTLTRATQTGTSSTTQSKNATTRSSTTPTTYPLIANQRGKVRLRSPSVAIEIRHTAAARVANPNRSE